MKLHELHSQAKGLCLIDPEMNVEINGFPPDLISWRGSYAEMSITSDFNTDSVSAQEFLIMLEKAMEGDTVFIGYKGGEYTMNPDTNVYADDEGESSGNFVRGLTTTGKIIVEINYG